MATHSKEWFLQAAADVRVKLAEKADDEQIRLLATIIHCMRNGVHDIGYTRNNLGYNSNLPSTVKRGNKFLSKKELFGKMWAMAESEVRKRVSNAVVSKVWRTSIDGLRGSATLLHAYCSMIEKETDTCKLQVKGESVQFSMDDILDQLHELIGTLSFEIQVPVPEASDESPQPNVAVSATVKLLHNVFTNQYRTSLNKFTNLREARVERADIGLDAVEWF